jgi:hypothetical protein
MPIACEGHPRLTGVSAGARFVQYPPRLLDEPLLVGDSFVDGVGCSIYGSVLRDESGFRMWYQAWPRDFDGRDSMGVGHAVSDDGLTWRKPSVGLVERDGTTANHLTDLPFHAPSVVVDPAADPARRYRAFGYCHPERAAPFYGLTQTVPGYYAAHSADGLHWTLEPEPRWPHADVITAARDPRGPVRVAYKHNGLAAGRYRRRFYTVEWPDDGPPAAPVSAFVADELDDQAALSAGCVAADYYGVSWVFPSGADPGPAVAIAWVFRHQAPLGHSADRLWNYGNHGPVDLQLRWQLEPGGRWLALPGRPDWLRAIDQPAWASGALYGASHALDVGDETWLYVTGTPEQHGWAGAGVDLTTFRQEQVADGGFARVGRLSWPRRRLLGVRAERTEWVDLVAGEATAAEPAGLRLNVDAAAARVALLGEDRQPLPGYGFDDCDALTGSHLEGRVTWQGSAALPPPDRLPQLTARVELTGGSLWAFDFAR